MGNNGPPSRMGLRAPVSTLVPRCPWLPLRPTMSQSNPSRALLPFRPQPASLAAALLVLAGGIPAQETALAPSVGRLGPAEIHRGVPLDIPTPPRTLIPHTPDHGEPVLPVGAGTLPQPNNPPSGEVGTGIITAPGDLRFWKLRSVHPASTSPRAPEPSACVARDTAFITANWTAGISDDSGHNFVAVDPYTRFPAVDGGFCCDQRCIYDPAQDITIWYLQYLDSATTGRGSVRIAVAVGRDGLRTNTWHSWVFQPESFNQPNGRWLDFPDMALSDGYLYCSSNIFTLAGSNVNSVAWRMSLADLRNAGGLGYSYFTRVAPGSTNLLGGNGSYRFAQGFGTTKYFGTQVNTSTARVIRWTDSPDSAFFNDRTVPTWLNGTRNALAPNGINWMGFADSRMNSGYQTASEYGFAWTCEEDPANSRPYPFVRTARFRTSDNTLIQAEDTYTTSYGVGYPAFGVNARGDRGVVAATGGPSRDVRSVAFIVDQYQPNMFGQVWAAMSTPTDSPPEARWGDYFTCMRHPVATQTFVGTGAYRDTANTTQLQFLWFSREQDEPTWVPLNVNSTPITGVLVACDVSDINGQASGLTNFVRSMPPSQGYTLTAAAVHVVGTTRYRFDRWVLNGVGQPIDDNSLTVSTIGAVADTAEAQYKIERTLNVLSTNPSSGVAITVSAADVNGAQNGSTAFSRIYKSGTSVTLTAPALAGQNPFKRWRINNLNQPLGQTQVTMTVDLPSESAVADYYIHTAGSFVTVGSGCTGVNGLIRQTASGTPETGAFPQYNVISGPVNSLAILVLGFSNTSFSGIPLPLPLGSAAPGCTIYNDLALTLNVLTNAAGSGLVQVPIPNDVNLIGGTYYTQYWGLQIGFNSLGLSFSNGITTNIGGNR